MSDAVVTRRRIADENHEVVTVEGGQGGYRRTPCPQCPWRRDAPIGAFPAEAYRLSANTAYDLSGHQFACHMSGSQRPATCAGFLLSGSAHNMATRMALIRGDINPAEVSSDVELYDSYREMAEANGVEPDDPALRRCR